MRIIVAVIVHDRFDNVREWIRCYKMCDTTNAELIIIHNYKNEEELIFCKNICIEENIKHVSRSNTGYDIGALQDVCRERLVGFPNDWDYLLWVTDDVIPMWKQFIPAFVKEIQRPNVGVACLEISLEITKHIRTSGFIISKETSLRLVFAADPIITKMDCYNFEHKDRIKALFHQITRMGKASVQVSATLMTSHLWDTDHRKSLNRWGDHYREFPKIEKPSQPTDSVLFIATIYNSYPQIISALICQTNPNWELLLLHDGPNNTGLYRIVRDANDDRITYIETDTRKQNWGHPLRKKALEDINNDIIRTKCSYIVITNSDNYYVPIFIEKMLEGFSSNILATYCSSFIHGYKSPQPEGDHKFGVVQSKIELGFIDCGMVMVKKEYACDVGWRDMSIYSDWTYFKDLIDKYGKQRWNKVLGCLFSHN